MSVTFGCVTFDNVDNDIWGLESPRRVTRDVDVNERLQCADGEDQPTTRVNTSTR